MNGVIKNGLNSLSRCTSPVAFGVNTNGTIGSAILISKDAFKKHQLPGDIRYLEKGNYHYEAKEVYIKQVMYNKPATIVFWSDGTKTVSKCSEGDIYNPEAGLAICILKKINGSAQVKKTFDVWCPSDMDLKRSNTRTIKQVRARDKNK